jgi:hypothetical protein
MYVCVYVCMYVCMYVTSSVMPTSKTFTSDGLTGVYNTWCMLCAVCCMCAVCCAVCCIVCCMLYVVCCMSELGDANSLNFYFWRSDGGVYTHTYIVRTTSDPEDHPVVLRARIYSMHYYALLCTIHLSSSLIYTSPLIINKNLCYITHPTPPINKYPPKRPLKFQ